MKQFLQCLTTVALVAAVVSIATTPPVLKAENYKPAPSAAEGKAVAVAKSPAPTKAAPAQVNSAAPAPTTPAPVAAAPVYPAGCANYLPLVQQYDWPVSTAMAVMQAENHACSPGIDNAGVNHDGSVDYGLFQVNSVHADMVGGNLESLRTPSVNVAVAYRIWSGRHSFTPWSTFNSGLYLSYLK